MEYVIGLILSLAVAGFAALIGFDRERAFYPTGLIVIAAYYVLFAAMGGSIPFTDDPRVGTLGPHIEGRAIVSVF
jgi:hypothetical protein